LKTVVSRERASDYVKQVNKVLYDQGTHTHTHTYTRVLNGLTIAILLMAVDLQNFRVVSSYYYYY